MTLFSKNFTEISQNDVATAGGKGASLGEMISIGLPVPPGFVVLASAFDHFMAETDLRVEVEAILKRVNHEDIYSVERASKKLRALIANVEFPEGLVEVVWSEFRDLAAQYVAVRSSATAEDSSTASWAGELETFLNTTEDNLLEAIKKCWSSLFTPRAIFYRFEKKLVEKKISVAVVVQKMVQAEVAGICFTVHPVTQAENQLIIEAGYGLGEAVVSGSITPDSYVVNKNDWSILDVNITKQSEKLVRRQTGVESVAVPKIDQTKQKLTNQQIIELAQLAKKVEDHYGFPCDIEWAMENGELYITQSRPITTL